MFPVPPQRPAPVPLSRSWQYELRIPRDPRGPRVARRTLRAVLALHELGELAERAELLASELATNSVRYTKGPASVRVEWLHPALRVSVWDPAPGLPVVCGGPRPGPPADADHGRGLLLLDLLADRWGACPLGDSPWGPGGKTIWFELLVGDGQPQAVAA